VIKNTVYIFSARISNVLFVFLLYLVVSRLLGPSLFGIFSFLTTVVLTASCLANYGLDTWMVREVVKNIDQGKRYLSNTLGLKMATSLSAIALTFLIFLFIPLEKETRFLLFIISTSLVFNSMAQTLWHYGDCFKNYLLHSILWAGTNVIKSTIGIFLAFIYQDLEILIWGLIFAEFAGLCVSFYIIKNHFGAFSLSFDFPVWTKYFSRATPLAIGAIFSALYFRLDIIMLKAMTDNEIVGWYSVAYKLIEGLIIIPHSILLVIFPAMVDEYSKSISQFRKRAKKTFAILFGVGTLLSILITLFSEKIISLLFGVKFLSAAPSLQVLSWAIVPLYINFLLSNVLISSGREKFNTYTLIFLTLVNAALNLVLIPKYQHIGAAWATLFSELVLLVLLGMGSRAVLRGSENFPPASSNSD